MSDNEGRTDKLEMLTVAEAAKELRVSGNTIRRRFRDMPGVFVLGGGRNETLRIPRELFESWVKENSRGFTMRKGGK